LDVTTLDGDHLTIDFTPVNYTPTLTGVADDLDDLAAHLNGLDIVIGSIGTGTIGGGGTVNTMAKFTGALAVGDSTVTDDGVTVVDTIQHRFEELLLFGGPTTDLQYLRVDDTLPGVFAATTDTDGSDVFFRGQNAGALSGNPGQDGGNILFTPGVATGTGRAGSLVSTSYMEARDAVAPTRALRLNPLGTSTSIDYGAATLDIHAYLDADFTNTDFLYARFALPGDEFVRMAGTWFWANDNDASGANAPAESLFSIHSGATAGADGVIFNEGGVDRNFRMEGANEANLFVLDGSLDAIGIGTAAPLDVLHVVGTQSIDSSGDWLNLRDGAGLVEWTLQRNGSAFVIYDDDNVTEAISITSAGPIALNYDTNLTGALNLTALVNGAPTDGDIWYDSGDSEFKFRQDGATLTLGGLRKFGPTAVGAAATVVVDTITGVTEGMIYWYVFIRQTTSSEYTSITVHAVADGTLVDWQIAEVGDAQDITVAVAVNAGNIELSITNNEPNSIDVSGSVVEP
jgi:hypothetical protein